ncbi:MAG: threonine--tRNA ligase [Candidatus Altiarchaeota archaeon]
MRILLLHSDYLAFECKKKAIKSAEDVDLKSGRVENVLVCFLCVEKVDEKDPEGVVKKLLEEIDNVKTQVGAEVVALYPYAHLSDSLASLPIAQKVLTDAFGEVEKKYPGSIKAPFGWYKSFELKCKGHPLSELSRTILPDGVEVVEKELKAKEKEEDSEALKAEEKIKSYWHIMTPDGKLHDITDYDFKGQKNLEIFSKYEKEKVRAVDQPAPHIELMRRLELVDYEPASDPGNFRYYPKGRMIKALLEEHVTKKILDYGGVEVETPIMYDFEHPTLKKYLARFPARQYQILSDEKKYFLRFAACFGQFLMASQATLSYRCLPLKLYELARYAFRREKSGELTGLRRLRAFTMPDVHALCSDMDQAMEEYQKRFHLSLDTMQSIGLDRVDLELAVRVTKDFFEQNKEFVKYLVKQYGKAALVEMWDERKFYFVLKYELNFVDNLNKASALSTDQIDVENGERYNIRYIGMDGNYKHPIILHCSPSGAIERVIYALLEKAYKVGKEGGVSSLPLWLSPTQVRIIPLSESFLDFAEELVSKIESENIRVDLDDRSESMGKKIREASREWVPYIVVVGEKEKSTGKLAVRVRETGEQVPMKVEEIIAKIKKITGGLPFRGLPLPKKLSERPKFV